MDKRFLKVWWIALLVKTILAILLPLANDEAYYWVWGHHPQLSYYDHPPMVGWLFMLGTAFEWLGNGARLPGVWLAHLTLLVWNQLIDPFLDDKKRPYWLIFVMLSPFFGVGSLILTPDSPMVFFWMLSLWLMLAAVGQNPADTLPSNRKSRSFLSAHPAFTHLALGLSLGLGFCSKYLIVLFVPASVIWLAFGQRYRGIKWKYVPLTVAAGLLACTPVLYWNWKNQWVSFAFQLHHGFAGKDPSYRWPIEYVLGQVALVFPPVLWLALQKREPQQAKFLHYFGWFPLAFFFYSSCRSRVEGNWPIMAHPEILSLALINVRASTREWKWMRNTAILWLSVATVLFVQALYPFIPIDPEKIKTGEFVRFDVYLPDLQAANVPIYTGSYQSAADMSYKMRRQICKLAGMGRRDFFDFQPQCVATSDKFVVGVDVYQTELPKRYVEEGYVITNRKRLNDDYYVIEVEKRAQDNHR